MTDFRGPRNVQLGFPVWAGAQYDPESRDYVVSVEGDDVERFRAVADLYGFREDGVEPAAEPEPPHAPPVDDESSDDDGPDPEPGEPDESDESDDDVDPEPNPEPEPTPAPAPKTRRPRRTR